MDAFLKGGSVFNFGYGQASELKLILHYVWHYPVGLDVGLDLGLSFHLHNVLGTV